MSRSLRLTVPASGAWVVLLRTAAAACCARLDFDLDSLEDVRLAVDEVATVLVADAAPDSLLECDLLPGDDGSLVVTLRASTLRTTLPPADSFAWALLTALVDDVTTTVDDGRITVVLQTSRKAPA